MARAGPRKVKAYSLAFKRAAVELSRRPGVQIQAVAQSLDMLHRYFRYYSHERSHSALGFQTPVQYEAHAA